MKTVMKVCAIVIVIISLAILTDGFAGEGKSFKKATGDAAKATVNYPANLVNETVNVVGGAAKNTADMVVDTAEATGKTLTGKATKDENIIVTPVKGSAETVKDAAVGTVTAPVKAAEKTVKQN